MKQSLLLIIVLLTLIVFLLDCSNKEAVNPTEIQPITMEEIYHYPITDIVSEDIKLQSQLSWHLESGAYDLEHGQSDTLFISNLSVLYEEADEHMEDRFRGQERGNIFVVSSEISTAFNDEAVEEYFFRDQKLDMSVTYYLVGSIEYREWISNPPLDNPIFIAQANNPVYWRQKFEFRLRDLIPLVE